VDTFLGLYANPKRKKVGDLLLQQIITFAFDVKKLFSLKAEVFKENLSAVKLYERFGFKIMQENEQLQIMELKKLTTIEGSE
jgi:UDP-4-amino-4,6-dideoxy-N-acetyl-beta-L-altrosamine N-acetyltransferase